MLDEFLVAFALLLVFEGIMPFLNPSGWRNSLRQVSEMDDKTLRLIGFISMLLGVMLLYLVH
jgi:uncharacterized protein YjeT (DUF2065 family)